MDVSAIKTHILEHDCARDILASIGCHHIAYHPPSGGGDGYLCCANPDGDNKNAINLYLNDGLICVNHTRSMKQSGAPADLFDLISYVRNCSFFSALKFVCDTLGLDYYADDTEELPESLQFLQLLSTMKSGIHVENDHPVKPIPETVLTYYKPYVTDLLRHDGIDYPTQRQFELGYDPTTNRITIPIRDELGTLVGVKGRHFGDADADEVEKYIYLEPCSKSKLLFGLHLTLPAIRAKRTVYVVESEKGVMQMWELGHTNTVAIGGKRVSGTQVEKLTRLGADLIFLLDKDVEPAEIEAIASRFIPSVAFYAVYDRENLLDFKQSPSDNPDILAHLLSKHIYRIQ